MQASRPTIPKILLLSCAMFGCIEGKVQAQQPLPSINSNAAEPVAVATLKVSVRRVVVDVTVVDGKGKPVVGLTQADFAVSEDSSPQTLRSFEVHTAQAPDRIQVPTLPVNTFSNLSSAPSGGPITVILYDLLNTPRDSQPFAHEQLLNFLRKRKASGQVAIFVLSDKLHMLQGFTEDDNKLIAALNLKKAKGYRSGLLQGTGEGTAGGDQLSKTEGNQNGADAQPDAAFQQVSAMLRHMDSMESTFLLDRRVDITAEALQGIARFLIGLPGRKNLLWMSASFPSGIVPDANLASRDAFDVTRNYSAEIVAATDLLTVSHVAVYPVDVRGLQTNTMFSAGNNVTFEPGQRKDGQAVQNFTQTLAAEHNTMDSIADSTGGRSFYNTNGLSEAAASAVEEGSVYYTLTYAPTNAKYDGKLRKVHVDLKQPGYRLAYRRTYFADDLENIARRAEENPSDALAVSLEHGAPAAHEIFFEAHVQADGLPIAATPEQILDLALYEAMQAKHKRGAKQQVNAPTMLQRYVIQYALLPRQIAMRVGPDGSRRDNLEFAVVSYSEDGLTLDGTRTRIQDVIRPERWALMQENGYHVPMVVLAPVQAQSLRLAVRDASNNHMGSLEISLPVAPEAMAPLSIPKVPTTPAPAQ